MFLIRGIKTYLKVHLLEFIETCSLSLYRNTYMKRASLSQGGIKSEKMSYLILCIKPEWVECLKCMDIVAFSS